MSNLFENYKIENEPAKTVLIAISQEQFQDFEYDGVRRPLTEAGYSFEACAPKEGESHGMFGTVVDADFAFIDINPENYKMLVILGGIGATYLYENKDCHKVINAFHDANKVIAAIGEAPMVLFHAGLLKPGMKITSHPSMKEDFAEKGIIYTGDTVTQDGNIITVRDEKAMEDLMDILLSLLPPPQAAKDTDTSLI